MRPAGRAGLCVSPRALLVIRPGSSILLCRNPISEVGQPFRFCYRAGAAVKRYYGPTTYSVCHPSCLLQHREWTDRGAAAASRRRLWRVNCTNLLAGGRSSRWSTHAARPVELDCAFPAGHCQFVVVTGQDRRQWRCPGREVGSSPLALILPRLQGIVEWKQKKNKCSR
jgi:hypothetical protein